MFAIDINNINKDNINKDNINFTNTSFLNNGAPDTGTPPLFKALSTTFEGPAVGARVGKASVLGALSSPHACLLHTPCMSPQPHSNDTRTTPPATLFSHPPHRKPLTAPTLPAAQWAATGTTPAPGAEM